LNSKQKRALKELAGAAFVAAATAAVGVVITAAKDEAELRAKKLAEGFVGKGRTEKEEVVEAEGEDEGKQNP
jgi:hypothetical protein